MVMLLVMLIVLSLLSVFNQFIVHCRCFRELCCNVPFNKPGKISYNKGNTYDPTMATSKYVEEYEYKDIAYRINESAKVHELFLRDGSYFEKYIKENANSIEVLEIQEHDTTSNNGKDPGKENIENNVKQFSWNSIVTKLLLTEYAMRKLHFRDPKVKKKTLWSQIRHVFENKGYTVSEELLDKKMRNLKSHYKTVKDNNKKNKTGRGRISWEYYDLLEDIFCDDKTINNGEVLSSMVIDSPHVSQQQRENCESTKNIFDDNSMPDTRENEYGESSQTINKRRLSDESDSYETQKKNKSTAARLLYKQRQTMIDLEYRRVAALESIANEISENNKIQRERNELLKHHVN